jgi:hypothetical protein
MWQLDASRNAHGYKHRHPPPTLAPARLAKEGDQGGRHLLRRAGVLELSPRLSTAALVTAPAAATAPTVVATEAAVAVVAAAMVAAVPTAPVTAEGGPDRTAGCGSGGGAGRAGGEHCGSPAGEAGEDGRDEGEEREGHVNLLCFHVDVVAFNLETVVGRACWCVWAGVWREATTRQAHACKAERQSQAPAQAC